MGDSADGKFGGMATRTLNVGERFPIGRDSGAVEVGRLVETTKLVWNNYRNENGTILF